MEINKIQILIRSFLHETKDVVKSPEESQKWLAKFRDTLNYQDLETEPQPYALALLREADAFNRLQKQKQMMRWAKFELIQEGVTAPTKEQIMQKCREKYQEFFETETESQPITQPQTTTNKQHRQQRKKPPTKEEVYDFAHEHNLDEVDARDWFERNFVERPGCDETGVEIKNWPGALIRSCQAAKKKRENK